MSERLDRWIDAVALGWQGVRGRPGRAVLSALGIALGIATLVLVTGIPASGRADLDRRLSALGTNLLVVPSAGGADDPVTLDPRAAAMARRIGPVESATGVANLNQRVLRDEFADPNTTAGITTLAVGPDLLDALDLHVARGVFLTEATGHLDGVVLGASAARWLGVTDLDPQHPRRVTVGTQSLTVVGVLAPTPFTPELDQAVLVGWGTAAARFGADERPSVIYVRADEQRIEAVRDVLPATLDPELPGLLSVSRPSDVLAAKRVAQGTFSGLFLGLAGVALAVGGIGVANTMIVSVLERRREIGLRRALGATRRDVRRQFVVEAVLLSLCGGAAGVLAGVLGSMGYALARGWPPVVPVEAVVGGAAGAVVIGALAGLYPAVRASRLSPTTALASA